MVFSDSRQDAAELANSIERSHYSDLIREAVYDELRREAIAKPALLEDLKIDKCPASPEALRLASQYPDLQKSYLDLIEAARADCNLPDDLSNVIREQVKTIAAQARKTMTEISARRTNRTVNLRLLFEGEDPGQGTGTLIQRSKTLGVNPAGHDVLYQDYYYDNAWRRWTTLFDFSDPNGGWASDLSPSGLLAREKLRSKVTSEICFILFSRLYFGFESAGLGFAMLNLKDSAIEEFASRCGLGHHLLANILNGTLRMLGDYYRYPQENPEAFPTDHWPDWESARAGVRNFVKKCAKHHDVSETSLLEVVREAICVEGGHSHFTINPRHLMVRVAIDSDPVWRCPGCRRPHLYNPGICTSQFCQNPLPDSPNAICEDLYSEN